jgi:adenylylsulfate kinase
MKNFCLWITGLPGSGKTTIVKELELLLTKQGVTFVTLNMDRIRQFVTPDADYTERERDIVYRSLVLMGELVLEHGKKNVILDATGNRKRYRNLARERIAEFAEIYIKCPLEVCRDRESARKGGVVQTNLYRKAEKGQLRGRLPGISAPYEAPENPEVNVDSSLLPPQECAKRIMGYIESRFSRLT